MRLILLVLADYSATHNITQKGLSNNGLHYMKEDQKLHIFGKFKRLHTKFRLKTGDKRIKASDFYQKAC